MDHDGRIHLGKGQKQARVIELKALPYFSLFLLAYTNTRTGLSGRSSFSLEFQQVAIDLVVYIGVVLLLTQV